jgi:hypothetical protein
VFEQFARQMRRGAGAIGTIREFIGLGLCRGDQVGDRLDRGSGIDHDDVEGARHQRHRCEIIVRVIGQFRLQARIDRIRERPHQQRVAVRRAGRDALGSDNGPRPRLVLDDDGGAEILCHLLRQRAGDHIGPAARRKRHHDLDDVVGVEGQSLATQQYACCKREQNRF